MNNFDLVRWFDNCLLNDYKLSSNDVKYEKFP